MNRTKWGAAAVMLAVAAASAQVRFIGAATIPGDATDKSGLSDVLSDGTPHNRLGSFGSGIAYAGRGNTYIAVDDRGPSDGAAEFRDRFQTFEIAVTPGAAEPVIVTLRGTTLFSGESGQPITGREHVGPGADLSLRLDPEGVRVSRVGTLWVSDEYGPWIDEFSMTGKRITHLRAPAAFLSPVSSGAADTKEPAKVGRQANRGMEGLAISPDGTKLYGIMQSPLLQDGALDAAGKRIGTNIRILELEIASRKTRQFLYPLASASAGVNEILAVNAHQFLVLERDGKGGAAAKHRLLYSIDIDGATDISAIERLPESGNPDGVVAVSKRPFLDFSDERFGHSGAAMPEKIEGLAFGPDLADGSHLLIVTIDNDLKADAPSIFWAFAIAAEELPKFEAQRYGVDANR